MEYGVGHFYWRLINMHVERHIHLLFFVFWSILMIQCASELACLGFDRSVATNSTYQVERCGDGFHQQSLLCSSCTRGYFLAERGRCAICPSVGSMWATSILGMLFGLFLMGIFISRGNQQLLFVVAFLNRDTRWNEINTIYNVKLVICFFTLSDWIIFWNHSDNSNQECSEGNDGVYCDDENFCISFPRYCGWQMIHYFNDHVF